MYYRLPMTSSAFLGITSKASRSPLFTFANKTSNQSNKTSALIPTAATTISSLFTRCFGLDSSLFSTPRRNMSMSAPPVVIQAKEEHSATILFFHGLGDSGHGWASSIAEAVPSYVKVICPTAPIAPVTLNGGYSMTSWFDLLTLDAEGPEDEKGIKAAGELVKTLIEEEEKRGIPTKRILIGGFSQGGGLSIHTALRYDKPLAGILALSCWLPLHKDYPAVLNPANKDISILMCHGDADVIVPFPWGKKSADMMKAFVPNIEFKTYSGMGHSSCPQEMRDAREFIRKILPAP